MPFVNLLTLTRQKPGFYVKLFFYYNIFMKKPGFYAKLFFLLQYINKKARFIWFLNQLIIRYIKSFLIVVSCCPIIPDVFKSIVYPEKN